MEANLKQFSDLQVLSDELCMRLELPKVLIIPFRRKQSRLLGRYCGNIIELCPRCGTTVETLVHELAHHLHRIRFERRIPGFYRMEKWPSMQPRYCTISDHKIWYAATGELKPVYFKQSSHGRGFKKCFTDICSVKQKYFKEGGGK